ncbi:hypothetical protein Agub_g13886 [Astrephomene gubernaculifera]|uniref:Uncharacterized protein n=1 Tax=Astrephomene gubernaculifera TaxID=47775 RepID=A0AAD3E0J0_9CHLO|nr:hypothetical protein Agub_g13886 [Astrephomene gubernaculifera]
MHHLTMETIRRIVLAWPLIVGLALLAYDVLMYAESLRAGTHITQTTEQTVDVLPQTLQRPLEDALLTALSPSHLHFTAIGPTLLPNAAHLLDTLLDDAFLNASATHWQVNASVLHSSLQLLRSGRDAILQHRHELQQQHHRRRRLHLWNHRQQQQQQSLSQPSSSSSPAAASLSDWLAAVQQTLAGLPAGSSSHPQLRRGLVALLLQARVAAGGSWSQSDEDAAAHILLQLYELHRRGATSKSAVEYYHFSKAAGTSVCLTSAESGCTTFSTSEQFTCLLPPFGDGPRWISRRAHEERCRRALPDSPDCPNQIYSKLAKWGSRYPAKGALVGCGARATALAKSGFNFYASEYTLRPRGGKAGAPPGLCAQFLNLAVLRSPMSRVSSHLRYVIRVTYDKLGNRTAPYFGGMRLADWRALLPAALDNYYVRGLLGEGVFYTGVGGLTEWEHLPAARAVLGGMDVLLLLEDPVLLSRLGHKWGLGWNATFLEAEGRRDTASLEEVNRIVNTVLPTGDEADSLAAGNALDLQLYDFAVLLSRLDAVVWAAAEAAGEPTKGKRRRRCGYVPAAPLPAGTASREQSGGGGSKGTAGRRHKRSSSRGGSGAVAAAAAAAGGR